METRCGTCGAEFKYCRCGAPATQHRVIPVEWHRVAVEPTCHACGYARSVCQNQLNQSEYPHTFQPRPVEPGDNAPARVETCKWCKGKILLVEGVWRDGGGHFPWICSKPEARRGHEPDAQPANTDDRTADTIPDWKKPSPLFAEWESLGRPEGIFDIWIKNELEATRERTGRAETRIEVLEAALRNMERRDAYQGSVIAAWESVARQKDAIIETLMSRAALAAPSGVKP